MIVLLADTDKLDLKLPVERFLHAHPELEDGIVLWLSDHKKEFEDDSFSSVPSGPDFLGIGIRYYTQGDDQLWEES